MRWRSGLMGFSSIAKTPVSHGVEPHDLETVRTFAFVFSSLKLPASPRLNTTRAVSSSRRHETSPHVSNALIAVIDGQRGERLKSTHCCPLDRASERPETTGRPSLAEGADSKKTPTNSRGRVFFSDVHETDRSRRPTAKGKTGGGRVHLHRERRTESCGGRRFHILYLAGSEDRSSIGSNLTSESALDRSWRPPNKSLTGNSGEIRTVKRWVVLPLADFAKCLIRSTRRRRGLE
jgi:hypothetical protein